MVCKRCMVVMENGTSFEHRKEKKEVVKRKYCECNKCHDRIYLKEPSFLEFINKASQKY